MWCSLASASVALGMGGGCFLDELEGRFAVDGRCGVDADARRERRGVVSVWRGVGSAMMTGVPSLS
jgi:hypothetical protein